MPATTLQPLIESLREELRQYGEMLALLDQQQQHVLARSSDDIFQIVAAIQAQGRVIEAARAERTRLQRRLAAEFSLPADVPFEELLPALPSDFQPLVTALIEENNDLLRRVHHRARQNHLLISRSLELMQNLISTLVPNIETSTYSGRGTRRLVPMPATPLYEAVG